MKDCDPATAFNDILDFTRRYIPRDPDDRPGSIRAAGATYAALVARLRPLLDGWGAPGQPHQLTGLPVTVDESLPAGAWRVVAVSGDIIRDSRSVNDPNGGRR